LNIDAGWYESVKMRLEEFYSAVVPCGFVSIDDYGAWPGCRCAVDEFFQTRALSFPLQRVDHTAH
jgi:O-methyltransferase